MEDDQGLLWDFRHFLSRTRHHPSSIHIFKELEKNLQVVEKRAAERGRRVPEDVVHYVTKNNANAALHNAAFPQAWADQESTVLELVQESLQV